MRMSHLKHEDVGGATRTDFDTNVCFKSSLWVDIVGSV